MPTLLLAGAYGQGNPGDEALLASVVQTLPEWEVVATSARPEETEARHGCAAVPAHGTAVMRLLRRTDAFVVGGGTIFKQLHPVAGRRPDSLLERTVAVLLAARATGQPAALIGVGAAPLHGPRSRALARLIVRSADLLVLRDEESASALLATGAVPPFRVGADPAWTVLEPHLPTTRAPGPPSDEVVVVPSVFAAEDPEQLVERLVAVLADVAAAGLRITVLPWQVGAGIDERLVAEVVARRVGGRLLDVPTDLATAQRLFAGARLVVGLRFHALMAAAAAGTPFLTIAHEPKLEGLARRLGQPAVAPDTPCAELARAVVDAAATYRPATAASVRGEVVRAGETMKLLRLLLGVQGDDPSLFADVPLYPQLVAR